MNRRPFPYNLHDGRGTWGRALTHGGKRTAIITCPRCGEKILLAYHQIDGEGNVNPGVVCSGDTCSFNAYITLEGWNEDGR